MTPVRYRALASILAISASVAACADTSTEPAPQTRARAPELANGIVVSCSASVTQSRVTCGAPSIAGARADIIGGQNTYVKLTSSNAAYTETDSIFRFDVTLQNLMPETMGSYGEMIPDPSGIRIFFDGGPTVTGGSGTITVANPDGTGTFTAVNQPYFEYSGVLVQNAVTGAKSWQLHMPPTVTNFSFVLLISAATTPALVINEVLSNPGGTITDASGEWVEIYNAGARQVDLQDYVMADSAASGRRPYFLIASSLVVPAGGYVVLGNTTNTTNNGGVPVDYAYGAAMALANSLDAIKLARVVGTDTLTIDRVQYANAAVSAQNGISRELKNPALDNQNMDGSNWDNASVVAVYGAGGTGTPKAINSTFTP